MKKIILLVGRSGSGKTTVADILENRYGLRHVRSYTTRPPRSADENGHVFVSEKEFRKLKSNMCAFTEFDGHRYGCLNSQVEHNDVYIIDPDGVEFFARKYNGTKTPVVIFLRTEKETAFRRMLNRGDSLYKAEQRAEHDETVFEESRILNLPLDVDIYNTDNSSAEEIAGLIAETMGVR